MKHLQHIVRIWQQLDVQRRRLFVIPLALVAAVGVMMFAFWLKDEHARLVGREAIVVGDLRNLQADVADVERLKGRAPPPRLAGRALEDSVVASIASEGIALSVTALDAGRLRVQGTGDFDAVVRWIGNTQQNFRLAVTSLSASRDQGEATVDMVLASPSE